MVRNQNWHAVSRWGLRSLFRPMTQMASFTVLKALVWPSFTVVLAAARLKTRESVTALSARTSKAGIQVNQFLDLSRRLPISEFRGKPMIHDHMR